MASRAPVRGGVRRLTSGRYQARYVGPDGQRRTAPTTFQTKGDARAWLASVTTDVSRGQWKPPEEQRAEGLTLREYAEAWLPARRVKGRPLADRTADEYRRLLDQHVLPVLGDRPLTALTRAEIARWYDLLGSAHPTQRARAYALLRTILGSAVDEEIIEVNPCRVRGGGSASRASTTEPASLDELAVIVEHMPERYRLMILLAAWCALRFGELTELRRGDIDTRHGKVRVRRAVVATRGTFVVKVPKSEAGVRDVAIPPHLMPTVKGHLREHTGRGADALLFPSAADPSAHLRQSALARVYYPARKAAGRSDLRFHDLRHTGAVLAAQTGASLAELMARLGHSTPQAAMRYQHAARGRDAEIAAALSRIAGGGQQES